MKVRLSLSCHSYPMNRGFRWNHLPLIVALQLGCQGHWIPAKNSFSRVEGWTIYAGDPPKISFFFIFLIALTRKRSRMQRLAIRKGCISKPLTILLPINNPPADLVERLTIHFLLRLPRKDERHFLSMSAFFVSWINTFGSIFLKMSLMEVLFFWLPNHLTFLEIIFIGKWKYGNPELAA